MAKEQVSVGPTAYLGLLCAFLIAILEVIFRGFAFFLPLRFLGGLASRLRRKKSRRKRPDLACGSSSTTMGMLRRVIGRLVWERKGLCTSCGQEKQKEGSFEAPTPPGPSPPSSKSKRRRNRGQKAPKGGESEVPKGRSECHPQEESKYDMFYPNAPGSEGAGRCCCPPSPQSPASPASPGHQPRAEAAVRAGDAPPLADPERLSVEQHLTRTKDGFILCLHRVSLTRGPSPENPERLRGPPVLLQHGFMMCSEVWAVPGLFDDHRCLPIQLALRGYDVWLGNNRGNKYSCKHESYKPSEARYWDFCLDDLVLFDIPAMIDCVLQRTGAPSLSYIGFSQGTAQAFGGLSIDPALAERVNIFIALAPAANVKNFGDKLGQFVLDPMAVASPRMLYALFGKKRLLPSTLFWMKKLSPSHFARIIDFADWLLFGWSSQNMDEQEKMTFYHHLYSYTSCKTALQWIQILRARRFQMFDDTMGLGMTQDTTGAVPPEYPIGQIQCPVALFFGGQDPLIDVDPVIRSLSSPTLPKSAPGRVRQSGAGSSSSSSSNNGGNSSSADSDDPMARPNLRGCKGNSTGGNPHPRPKHSKARSGGEELCPLISAKRVEKYEHLDFLWASDIDRTVYPDIFRLLERFTHHEAASVV